MADAVTQYLQSLRQNLDAGIATERSYYPALQRLLEELAPKVKAITEPKRIACGAPDFAVLRDGLMVGHVEAKDVGISLNDVERSDQLLRYRRSLGSLLLTDFVEFRWYVDGELRRTAQLARFDSRGVLKRSPAGAQSTAELLGDFLAHEPQPIVSPRALAERMARLTHLIREIIVTAFEKDAASDLLIGWRQSFAEILLPDIALRENVEQFADMFAQTLAYGLFSARIRSGQADFTRRGAQELIPRTNPFLRELFWFLTGPQLQDEPYAGLVEDLVQLLALAQMEEILADFGKRTRQDDPVVHFYETFLAAYDPELRARRGVFYTPAPVVSFIVRSVDLLLKSKFGLPEGLADTSKVRIDNLDPGQRTKSGEVRKTTESHRVLILDPAVGTATFLYTIIDLIRSRFMERGNAGMWSGYVREHLLPRIFGFELLMAPYAVAHFKLALQLAGHDLPPELRDDWAYDFSADERIGIYLTNTLDGPHEYTGLPLLTQFLARESAAADEIKRHLPIMVVTGNPPYSGHSANSNDWIDDLLHGKLPDGSRTTSYYEVDGQPLGERNPKWLQDDYVKFIRFGQWRIEQSGGGILAFISNNGYLDNPTFRGMRQSLMETFTDIYILDLHGNARKKETAPDGSADENVFDIMQGVAIGLFVKEPGKTGPAKVYHADLWGARSRKYQRLHDRSLEGVNWQDIQPQGPQFLFISQDLGARAEYRGCMDMTQLMTVSSVGIVTGQDARAIGFSQDHANELAIALGVDPSKIRPLLYRPFDRRFVVYDGSVVTRARYSVMRHMLSGDNLGTITTRQTRDPWGALVTECICGHKSYSAYDINTLFPLYLYPEDDRTQLFDTTEMSPWPPDPDRDGRVPNLAPSFIADFEGRLGLPFAPHKITTDPGPTFGPEDVFRYIYAIFHSPTYRERYAEFLKIDFPRIPLTSDPDLFRRLVSLGDDLVRFHLLEHPKVREHITSFPIPGNAEVLSRGGYPTYTPPNPSQGIGGRVHINKQQYFEGVPEEVWAFQVGGYQVLHKWLKDRRGRLLTFDDLLHYQNVVVALQETIRLMAEIDEAIPAWPIE